ncbi:hypothetical protein ENTCAN_06069 [Enterobacter cancerogenus ATCC 35316]|nr:hypothetical protein ENTCAN_06069 [Enterobacter cancerogenus ATCC 35316]
MVVPVISLKIVIKHLTQDVKVDSRAVGISKTTRNAPLKQVRKGVRIVMAEAVVLTNPDLNYVSLNT